jgi:fatty-acyl-CoA synthase
MVVDVLASKGFTDDSFSSLKVMTGGGASMPAAVVQRLRERWGLRFAEGYGLTETISATHLNPLDAPKPQCLGLPIYNTHALVADPETLTPCAQGGLGEILISGPQVMQGYWNRPKDTAEALVDLNGRRWLRTGDLGYVDADGYYFIVDRLKRMINSSGYKVWPAECEMLLYSHPAVAECAVISAPDPRRGEKVRAVVVLHPDQRGKVSENDIIDFARTLMAAYKVPREVEFRDALPRSGSRKVDWRALQAEAWEGHA